MIAQEWQIEQKDKGSSLYLEKQGPSLSFTNFHVTWHFVCPVVLEALEIFAFWGREGEMLQQWASRNFTSSLIL